MLGLVIVLCTPTGSRQMYYSVYSKYIQYLVQVRVVITNILSVYLIRTSMGTGVRSTPYIL
jgi:hypothetical protein